MIEIGRLCVKIAGRDAGKKCVVVDLLDKNYVLIDGATRRKKCNISHLEPISLVIKIKKKASHEEVVSEFKKLGIDVVEKKPKPKKEKPSKLRKKDRKEPAVSKKQEKSKEGKPKKETKKK